MDANNALFRLNLSNFDSRVYWYNALSKEKFKKKLLGKLDAEEKPDLILPVQTVGGQTLIPPIGGRRKRAALPAGPECINLPAYKNWAEEGKTTPVQDQGACGMP